MKRKKKSVTRKPIGNRTVIGIACILAALGICFGVAPLINKVSSSKQEIVRVVNPVLQGNLIREDDIEIVEVGNHNLPKEILTKAEDVIGKYATVDLFAGDHLLPQKLTSDIRTATDILGGLDSTHKAISVSIGSFAQGVSGKLETGDIISVLVYTAQDGMVTTPPELQYVKVITSTTSSGVDKSDVTDKSQPVTVTLLVNQKQAELLAGFEKTATMHFTLEYRGDAAVAQQYLDTQQAYFDREG